MLQKFCITCQNGWCRRNSASPAKDVAEILHHQPKMSQKFCITSQRCCRNSASPAKDVAEILHHQPKMLRKFCITCQRCCRNSASPAKDVAEILHHQPKMLQKFCITCQRCCRNSASPAKDVAEILHHLPKMLQKFCITCQRCCRNSASPAKMADVAEILQHLQAETVIEIKTITKSLACCLLYFLLLSKIYISCVVSIAIYITIIFWQMKNHRCISFVKRWWYSNTNSKVGKTSNKSCNFQLKEHSQLR